MPTPAAGSFAAALAAFAEDLRRRWYSEHTQRSAMNAALRFVEYLRGQRVRDVRAVTEAHVTAYALHLKRHPGRPYAVATQRTYLQAVQMLFRFLRRTGTILRDPTVELVLPHWKRLPRAVLNQTQARRLVATPAADTARGQRDRAVIELLYGAAIRVGECERLDLGDLDLARERLLVRLGKGRKDRVVPVTGRAAAALDLYLREARPQLVKDPAERALFITHRGQRLDVRRIQDLVRMNARAAGLEIRVSPHTLRHGCATHLLQGGADIRHVQALLGHASVQTTEIYTKVAATDVAKMVRRAHPREKDWKKRPKS